MTPRLLQTGKKKEDIVARGRACAVARETRKEAPGFPRVSFFWRLVGLKNSDKLADWGKTRASLRRSRAMGLPYNTRSGGKLKQRKDVTRSM